MGQIKTELYVRPKIICMRLKCMKNRHIAVYLFINKKAQLKQG